MLLQREQFAGGTSGGRVGGGRGRRRRRRRTRRRGARRRRRRRILEAAELLDEFLAERRLVGARLRELALEAVELLRRVLLVALPLLVRALQRRAQPLDLALGGGGALLVL